jgi:protein phosphatase
VKITLPELSLVVLIGPSGAGKSTFARTHFRPTEVISSDTCRGLVSDDENDLAVTEAAFSLVHFLARKRLELGRLTVIDATSVDAASRAPLVALAREHHCLPVAIVFNLPERVCHARNQGRPDRQFGPHVVRSQRARMKQSLRDLEREGLQEEGRRGRWTGFDLEGGPSAITRPTLESFQAFGPSFYSIPISSSHSSHHISSYSS